MNVGDSHVTAAGNALLGRKVEMLQSIKQILEDDRTFKVEASEWPVFEDYTNDPAFRKLIGEGAKTHAPISNVVSIER